MLIWVRLVRACGSKRPGFDCLPVSVPGQARKSLWIETRTHALYDRTAWVRLVRACGSKLVSPDFEYQSAPGQARKSLWIETIRNSSLHPDKRGQARKSLWIETGFQSCQSLKDKVRLVRACGSKQDGRLKPGYRTGVRLVRACGSKPIGFLLLRIVDPGQARKSLWIETAVRVTSVTCSRRSGS